MEMMLVLHSLRLWQAHDLRYHGLFGQARKWPRSSSTPAVARSWLVLMVTIALPVCFDVLLAASARWYAATLLWTRVALFLFVVWCSCVHCRM